VTRLGRVLPLAALVLLAACATHPPYPQPDDPALAWRVNQARNVGIEQWRIQGRVAVRTDQRRGGQATVYWDRDGSDHQIRLHGPLGSDQVRLTQNADGAEMVDNRNNHYTAATAEELLYRVAGWHVPFEQLRYWVSGLPAPGGDADFELDAWGRLETLRQYGWEVRFIDYRTEGPYQLPSRVFVKSLPGTSHVVDSEELGDEIEVRLVIRRWEV